VYTLIRGLEARQILARQLPALAGALVIAQTCYRFGSFALEALAFLATWFALDAALAGLSRIAERLFEDRAR
jgi:hypothetical protein